MPALAPPAAPTAPAAPAAPPAPAAAKSQQSQPAQALKPDATPDNRTSSDEALQDVYSEIDALDKPSNEQKPKQPQKAKVEPPKKPDDDPHKEADVEPAKAEATEREPVKLNDLRSAYANLKKKVKDEYEPKAQSVSKLEARIKELEQTNPAELTTLQERLQAAEKRRDELEQQIHFVDYSKSSEFKSKYEDPYKAAWADARKDLAELAVENEDGTTRAASDSDMIQLASMPLGAARKLANSLFGDSADDVMAHRRRIIDLSEAQTRALNEAQTKAVERAKMTDMERRTASEKNLKLWTEANSAVATKFPKTFGKLDDDPEGNAMLEKGFALADRLFAPTDESRPKTPEEAVKLHALIRHKIANHDRALMWLKSARGRIAELEAAVAQYEKSDPNGGLDGTSESGTGMSFQDEVNAEIDRLERRAR